MRDRVRAIGESAVTPCGPQINGADGGYRVGRYREVAVPPALGPVAEVAWRFGPGDDSAQSGARDAPQRILPETGVSLAFTGCRDRNGRLADLALVVMGPIATVRFFAPDSETEMVGVRLRPEWCHDLLGVHAGDARDSIDVVPHRRWTGRLAERLARTRDSAEAASELLTAVGQRWQLARVRPVTRLANRALERVRGGDYSAGVVRATARELGVSPRQLRRVVDQSCGCAIKWFQRVRRLHHAVSAATGTGKPSWSALAADAGYYDQAHMIHEFRALAGVTPVALLAERSLGNRTGEHSRTPAGH